MTFVDRQRGARASRLIDTDHGDDWRNHAACRGEDPELFYPAAGQSEATEALRICRRCPVAEQCLAWAEHIGDDWAVLGGTTAKQRRNARLRRTRIGQRRCQFCRELFWTVTARYCTPGCRQRAAHAMRSGTAAARNPDLNRLLRTGRVPDADVATAAGVTLRTVQRWRRELQLEGTPA